MKPLHAVHAQPLARAPEAVVLALAARVEQKPRGLGGSRRELLLGGGELERLLRFAHRRGEVRGGQFERGGFRARPLDVVRLVEEQNRVVPPNTVPERLAQFRVDQVIVRREDEISARRHVLRRVVRTRPAPPPHFSFLAQTHEVLDVHRLALAERRVRPQKAVHLVVVRAGPRLRLLSARRLLRDAGQAPHLLVHAHLRPRADHRHARAVPRRLQLLDHLRQLRVRAAGVHDHGAARRTRVRVARAAHLAGADFDFGRGARRRFLGAGRVRRRLVLTAEEASSRPARVRLAPPERRAQQAERLAGACAIEGGTKEESFASAAGSFAASPILDPRRAKEALLFSGADRSRRSGVPAAGVARGERTPTAGGRARRTCGALQERVATGRERLEHLLHHRELAVVGGVREIHIVLRSADSQGVLRHGAVGRHAGKTPESRRYTGSPHASTSRVDVARGVPAAFTCA